MSGWPASPSCATTAALVDPFGIAAFGERQPLLDGGRAQQPAAADSPASLLWNRLLWLGVALAALALAFFAYRFADRGMSRRQRASAQR